MSDGPQPRAAWPPVAGPTVGKPPAGRRATPVLAGGPVCAGRVRCRPRHAGGAVVVAPAPAAAWLVACTGPCWRRRARVGPASRPRRGGALQSPAAVGGAASRAVSQPHQARHGRQHAPGRSSRARWGHAHSPLSLAPCQPLSPTTQRVWRPPAARVVPAWVAEVGHWEARAPASGASNPTKACRRRLPASARPSLPLPAAPDAQR